MNTNKNLLRSLFLVLGTVACVFSAYAANSVFVNTKGAKGETTAMWDNYRAYYCTKDDAKDFFGGADTYQAVTAFLTANMSNFESGMSALATGGDLAIDTRYGFDVDEYTFSKEVQTFAVKDYLAILAYAGTGADAEKIVRVFSSSPHSDVGGVCVRTGGSYGDSTFFRCSWGSGAEPDSPGRFRYGRVLSFYGHSGG